MTEHHKQQGGQPAGQWAQQQKEGMKHQDDKAVENGAGREVEGGKKDQQSLQGENRTPDKTIGQVEHADGQGNVHEQRGQNQPADTKRAVKSQMEGPAAYAPLPDEHSSADEAREKQENADK